MFRKMAATVAAALILVFGSIVGAWLTLVGLVAAVVSWPGLLALALAFAGLAWAATGSGRVQA